MSGRQQRVMVQPIVRTSPFIPFYSLTTIAECHLQKLAAGLVQSPCFDHHSLTTHVQRTKVVIWLYDNIEMRIEGRIIVRLSDSSPDRFLH